MAQEAPRLRELAKPIQEPRGCGHRAAHLRRYGGTTRALRRDASRCADPSQEASAAPALSRPTPTGPHTRSQFARLGGQARLGPQQIVGAKGQRLRRPAAQPWRPEPGGGQGSAQEVWHATDYEPHKAMRQA